MDYWSKGGTWELKEKNELWRETGVKYFIVKRFQVSQESINYGCEKLQQFLSLVKLRNLVKTKVACTQVACVSYLGILLWFLFRGKIHNTFLSR